MTAATQSAKRTATYADIERLPANIVGEIIHGMLLTHPRPSPRHAATSSALGVGLGAPFQWGNGGPGGWVFLVEPELHLDGHVVVPDLAGWRRETLPMLPDTAWLDVPPDWLCEIVSPATERYDRGVKREIYAAAGVAYLWLLDPVAQILEAFVLTDGKWLLIATHSGADEGRVPPFEAIVLSLPRLWPFDAPKPAQET